MAAIKADNSAWSADGLEQLHREFGAVYGGRTVLVTGADGFVGSHLTEALVELGAHVHAFARATSSGALNNIASLRQRLHVHFADLTDRTSVDYLDEGPPRRAGSSVRLPPRRPGPRRRVVAPPVRDDDDERHRHAQPAPVDRRPRARAREVRHRRHVGGVRQPARFRRASPRLRRERQPDPARALADQSEVGVRDVEGRGRLPDA